MFWRGDPGMVGVLASRIAGSADIYQKAGKEPLNSINFVTCHDGFTLNDLVSYNEKHNEANGEDNRDGTDCNYSFNYGAEGESDDPAIEARQATADQEFHRHAFRLAGRAFLSRGATSSGGRRKATTTPTARTTRYPGMTGDCLRRTAVSSGSPRR